MQVLRVRIALMLVAITSLGMIIPRPIISAADTDKAESSKSVPKSVPVAPLVTEETLFVVRVGVGRPEAVDLANQMVAMAPLDFSERLAALAQIGMIRKMLKDQGIVDAYFVSGTFDLVNGPHFIISRPGLEAKDADLKRQFSFAGTEPIRVGDLVILGIKPAQREAWTKRIADARPELTEALEMTKDALAVLAIVPSTSYRRSFEQVSPEFPEMVGGGSIKPLTQGMRYAIATIASDAEKTATFRVVCKDVASAEKLSRVLTASGQRMAQQDFMNEGKPFVIGHAKAIPMLQEMLTPKIDGTDIVIQFGGMSAAQKLVKLFGDDGVNPVASSRTMNTLKQLALAVHNFEAVNSKMPGNILDKKTGKPLLSSRVSMLPYIEEDLLYRQFKLDEPWDSPNNKPLIAKMPKLFATTGAKPTMTVYQRPVGEKMILKPDGTALNFNQITDGTSNTILILDMPTDQAVVWTKPDDWAVPNQDALKAMMANRNGNPLHVAFGDGSVRRMSPKLDEMAFQAVLTASFGEVVNLP